MTQHLMVSVRYFLLVEYLPLPTIKKKTKKVEEARTLVNDLTFPDNWPDRNPAHVHVGCCDWTQLHKLDTAGRSALLNGEYPTIRLDGVSWKRIGSGKWKTYILKHMFFGENFRMSLTCVVNKSTSQAVRLSLRENLGTFKFAEESDSDSDSDGDCDIMGETYQPMPATINEQQQTDSEPQDSGKGAGYVSQGKDGAFLHAAFKCLVSWN